MKSSMTKLAAAVAAMLVGGAVMADDATFGVSATIAPECVVGSTTNMDFATLGMLDTSTGGLNTKGNSATASFKATCTNGTTWPMLAFSSAHTDGSAFRMAGPDTTFIAYSLKNTTNNANEAIVHNTAATFAGLDADGTVKSLTLSGTIAPADKDGKVIGAYSDTVTITTSFGVSPP